MKLDNAAKPTREINNKTSTINGELRRCIVNYKEISVSLVNLIMDKTNPRHPDLNSQREIIDWMISGNNKTGEKLFNLAKDILKHGINPAEKVVITKEKNDKDYVVLEGNRRVTAIKLLNNPDIAPNDAWKKRFRSIITDSYQQIKEISCIYYRNPEDAFHFIELKHMGEANGVGIVPWDSEQKARHAKRVNRKKGAQKALSLIDHIRSSPLYEESVKQVSKNKFPLTTLDRLLSDVDFRAFLGLGIDSDGNLVYAIDPQEAKKPISKVIEDLGTGKKKVGNVINKKARELYINEFPSNSKPDVLKQLVDPIPVLAEEFLHPPTTRSPRYQLPANRKHVVLQGTNIAINPSRFNRQKRIYDELRKLPLKDREGNTCFPNAAILLIRLFIETSITEYIDVNKISSPNPKDGWKDISLVEKMKRVLTDIEKKGKIAPKKAVIIKKLYADPKKLCYPGSLNDFAHNRFQVITPAEVTDFWDSYVEFLSAIYENM